MSNNLPKNGSQFADRRNTTGFPPTPDQLRAQQEAGIAQLRLNLSTQFLNTLIPVIEVSDEDSSAKAVTAAIAAVNYADALLIRLGIAEKVETVQA